MLLVDTNVLVDLFEDDPLWADWSVRQLRAQAQVHQLLINPVICAELSLTFASVAELDETIEGIGLRIEQMPRASLFLSGRAFLKYRRAGGTRTKVLPDFFIGAHASVLGCGILTRDEGRYRSYFPRVPLVTPREAP